MNKETIEDAIDRLEAQGKRFVSTQDVAEVVETDEEITQGKRGYIGRLMNELDNVEQWAKASKSMTYRIKDGEQV